MQNMLRTLKIKKSDDTLILQTASLLLVQYVKIFILTSHCTPFVNLFSLSHLYTIEWTLTN